MVEDLPDPNDGRSKLIRITSYGKETLLLARQQMEKVMKIVGGPMDKPSKIKAVLGSQMSVQFHKNIWEEAFDASLDELATQYLPKENE